MQRLKALLFAYILLSTVAIVTATTADAQTVNTKTNLMIPFTDLPQPNPCSGEIVLISGNLHMLISTTINANIIRIRTQWQGAGFRGIGQTTGDVYQAVGTTNESTVMTTFNGMFVNTLANNLRVVGPGPDNNFLLHQTLHMTINANGDLTVSFDEFWTECR